MKKLIFILFLLCGGAVAASPHSAYGDSLEISLLTCEPGPAIYENYGHTAMRVRTVGDSVARPLDLVFNYGCFDFNEPHFIERFALGLTYYMLCAIPYRFFEYEYLERGRMVWQQTLNLTDAEAQRIASALIENARPDKRVYKYNFLYNNCTTKCRDIIEDYVTGEVQWGEDSVRKTFREMLHERNMPFFVYQQLVDIYSDTALDDTTTAREELFLPTALQRSLSTAVISQSGMPDRPLVRDEFVLVNPPEHVTYTRDRLYEWGLLLFFIPYFIFYAFWMWKCYRRKHFGGRKLILAFNIVDIPVLAIAGVMGCGVAILVFFSTHPAVTANWQLLVFNPIQLFVVVLWKWRRIRIYLQSLLLMFGIIFCLLVLNGYVHYCCLITMIATCLTIISSSANILRYHIENGKKDSVS